MQTKTKLLLSFDEIKKIQMEELEKLDMDLQEVLEYGVISTPDGSIKIGKIDNVIKGIHKIANINPEMNINEYEQLKDSLLQIGQQEPVILYRGYIVDGRHRLKALKELKVDTILYRELPRNTSLETLKEIVMSKEARRHLSKTQKAVRAFFDMEKHGGTKSEYAIKHGVDRTYISKCELIKRKLGTDVLNELLKSGKVKLENGRYYSNLSSIVNYIKQRDEKQKKINDLEPTKKSTKKIFSEIKNFEIDELYEIIKLSKMLIENKNKEI